MGSYTWLIPTNQGISIDARCSTVAYRTSQGLVDGACRARAALDARSASDERGAQEPCACVRIGRAIRQNVGALGDSESAQANERNARTHQAQVRAAQPGTDAVGIW